MVINFSSTVNGKELKLCVGNLNVRPHIALASMNVRLLLAHGRSISFKTN